MTEEELIHGCLRHERVAQRALYDQYFGKMMNVSIRYAKNNQEAKEILHMAFKNVFAHTRSFAEANAKRKIDSPVVSLEEWIKKLVIEAAVQHMHNNKKEYFVSSTVNLRDAEKSSSAEIPDEHIISSVNKNAVVKALQQLSPSYRAVFNMHEVDGYSHPEISKLLDISESTSRDNLSKAKFNIKKNLVRMIAR